MLDLQKMKELTAQAVRQVCDKRTGPCVGFCLLFLEFDDNYEKKWGLETHLVGDAHDPMEEEDREALKKSMQYVMHNAMLIYEGEEVAPEGDTN